ncbi:MAG: hypothetical protein [Caudoviricetes sp.]|nr:MAG: hypothetical protein [Caudoviricetes sp.]
MSVVTRIDSRSDNNKSLQLQDADGNIIAVIRALTPSSQYELTTHRDVVIVKSNGAVLKRKD